MSRSSSSPTPSFLPRLDIRWFLFLILLLAYGCGAQEEAHHRVYVEQLGQDTIAVEKFTRTARGFEGNLLVRSPVTRVAHYTADLGPEGGISRLNVEWQTPAANPGGPAPQGFTITIAGDSATVERRGGNNPGIDRIVVPDGAIPDVGRTPVSYAILEQAVRQAMASGGGRYDLNMVQSNGRIATSFLEPQAPDTYSMDFFGFPFMATVSADGEVMSRSGAQTTMKAEGKRVADINVDSLAEAFAARDARGQAMGAASPLDSTKATIKRANLRIVYSRPAKRGRDIWGNLVPWDTVWRTGANAATSFTTNRAVRIGGTNVPAGSYTLWTIFTADTAKLIINRQTGQWGTQYDAAQDLVRVDLTKTALSEPAERFTISLETTPQGGMLHLDWDATRYSVPVRVP